MSSQTTSQESQSNLKPKFDLKPESLYLLLTNRNDNYTFHWGLYIARTRLSGVVHHLINDKENGGAWIYEAKSSENVVFSQSLLVAIQLAEVASLHDYLADIVAAVPLAYSTRFRENITCRVWVKEALFALDQSGVIKILKDVDAVEQEALSLAIANKHVNKTMVHRSKHTQL